MIDISDLPMKFKLERIKRGWKQADVAEKLGVSQVQVSHWEISGSIPTLYYLVKLCQLYQTSLDEIMEWNQ